MSTTPPTPQELKAELFHVLGNLLRVRILEMLRAGGSLTVGEVQQRLGITTSNVSQHLGLMRRMGIVRTRREGTSIWYSVADPRLYVLLDTAQALFEQPASLRIHAMRSTAE